MTQIIDEKTGKMVRFKTDAIMLKNVVCEGALCNLPSLLSARNLSLLA